MVAVLAGPALADDRPFAFAYGTDIETAGEKEIEQQLTWSSGHAGEAFQALQSRSEFEYGFSDTFQGSLSSLRRRGLLVGVGTASGAFPPIDAMQLAMKGSLYFTRPALADYIADPEEKAALAEELFGHVAAGRIRIEVNQHYALQDAVQAHRDLESRKTTGSSIFVV